MSALLKTGLHSVTALSRQSSSNKLPDGVSIAIVDYDNVDSIVTALQSQNFLIITLSPTAPKDTHSKLVQAAAKAGARYVMPNGYAGDMDDVKLGEDTLLGPVAKANRDEIERLGMQWITVCCGFWYEYSLAGGEPRLGFNFDNKSLTLYDDGNTKNSISTLPQFGRAIATVLSLKEHPDSKDDNSLVLSNFSNQAIYIKSFVASQKDMFESVKRVSKTTGTDCKITYQSPKVGMKKAWPK